MTDQPTAPDEQPGPETVPDPDLPEGAARMTQDRRAPDVVKLRVRYKPSENMPARESLWAEPVEADQGGGSYRLQNSSFVVPLAAGDVVRAEQAGDGELQLTGLVSTSDSVLTVLGAPPGAELDLQPVVETWSAGGALWTESNNGLLMTVWPGQMRLEAIESVVRPSLSQGLTWLATAFPSIRVAENMPEVDFELERVVVELVEETDDEE